MSLGGNVLAGIYLAGDAGPVNITESGVSGTEIGRNVVYGVVTGKKDVCVKPDDNIIYVDCKNRGKRK